MVTTPKIFLLHVMSIQFQSMLGMPLARMRLYTFSGTYILFVTFFRYITVTTHISCPNSHKRCVTCFLHLDHLPHFRISIFLQGLEASKLSCYQACSSKWNQPNSRQTRSRGSNSRKESSFPSSNQWISNKS